jgi:hypothetical protein
MHDGCFRALLPREWIEAAVHNPRKKIAGRGLWLLGDGVAMCTDFSNQDGDRVKTCPGDHARHQKEARRKPVQSSVTQTRKPILLRRLVVFLSTHRRLCSSVIARTIAGLSHT